MNYSDLTVWQKAMQFVTELYKVTAAFPKEEKYGLVDQMRRAAVSVPSNIAEGHSRKAKADFSKFLRIALGSLTELETQIIISKNLSYIDESLTNKLLDTSLEIKKMLQGLLKSLNK